MLNHDLMKRENLSYEAAEAAFASSFARQMGEVNNLELANRINEMAAGDENAYRIVVPDNTHGGRGFDLASLMFKSRILYLEGPVSQQAVWELERQIHYLCSEAVLENESRTDRITLYIDSPGGYVDWGLTLYEYLEQAKAITGEPVVVVMKTQAASMGSLLMQSASPYMRLAFPRSIMMIHGLAYGMQGKLEGHMKSASESVERAAQLYAIYEDKIIEALKAGGTVTRDGQELSDEELQDMVLEWLFDQMEDRDTFLKASECLKAGLIDFFIFEESEQFQYMDHVYWYMGLKRPSKTENALDGEFDDDGVFTGPFMSIAVDEGDDPLSDDEKADAVKALAALKARNLEKVLAFENSYNHIKQRLLDRHNKTLRKGNTATRPLLDD